MKNNQLTSHQKTEIIAEVGSNYNDSLEEAKKFIQASFDNGASAVKFQTLRKNKLIAPKINKKEGVAMHPAWDTFSNLELSDQWHFELKDTADKIGIEFLSTPFYLEAIKLLENVGVKRYKIASGDITFLPLIEEISRTKKPVILSTGASTLDEIETALNVLEKNGSGPVTLLHCVASYPTEIEDANLRAMVTMKKKFGLNVGISDHTIGDIVAMGAVALGASIIEKHVTFDRSLDGPDHPFAMTMSELKTMVKNIRLLEKALGNGKKWPSIDEQKRKHRFRRGKYNPTTFEPTHQENGIWLRPEHNVFF